MNRMSFVPRIASVAALLALCSVVGGAQIPATAPAPGPVKPAAIPAFQEATLPNGLRILLVESKRQPVVSLALMLPAGDAYDPAGKEGLARTFMKSWPELAPTDPPTPSTSVDT